jgi:hypothetical protein
MAVLLISFLAGIALLDMIFIGSAAAAANAAGESYRFIFPATGTWFAATIMGGLTLSAANTVNCAFILHASDWHLRFYQPYSV